jgi:hypothetical protein
MEFNSNSGVSPNRFHGTFRRRGAIVIHHNDGIGKQSFRLLVLKLNKKILQ